jgi:circadian clock protein KaiC
MTEAKPTAKSFWTGLPALDQVIIPKGIPLRSLNVIGGGPGTGKTVLALQMLFANASPENRAIYFTTISEPTIKFLAYLQDFSFYDREKMFSSILVRDIGEAIQTQPLPQVIMNINDAIKEESARLVVIDSFKAISDIVPQAEQLRIFAYNLAVNLVSSMCTAFLVGEYTYEDIVAVPVFAIADGIVNLSFRAEGLNRQRYLEVHKVRGRPFVQGLHPFSISPSGITIYPRIRTPEHFEEYAVGTGRASTGLPSLDEMLDGGLPEGSATMVAGGAGTGKTLMGLHFITSGAECGEPGVIVTFQENPAQLREIARAFGWDLRGLEEQGKIAHLYHSPVEIQPDIHTALVKEAVEQIGARRVLIDSLKDLEIATSDKVRFKDYVYSLVNELKRRSVTTLLTNEISELFGSFALSEFGVSFIADNVILLRYVEMGGRMGRALSVLKVRGSQHDKDIREFEITEQGLCIGKPIRAMTGVLTGNPVVGEEWGWRELEPGERYVMEILRDGGPATLAEMVAATMIPPDGLEPLLSELAERGYVLPYGRGDGQRYKVTV